MRPCAMVLAACLALAISAIAGCGGPQASRAKAHAGETKAPGAEPKTAAQAAGTNREGPAPAEPAAPTAPGSKPESPAAPSAEPPKPVVNLETPVPLVKMPTLPVAYTWQAGDNLFLVARRFYGDGRLWPRIVEANRQIQGLVEIPPGTVITIPAR